MVTAELQDRRTQLARVCKALGNPTRLQIIRYVRDHPGCIATTILLHLPDDGPHAQSTLSQHLKVLRDAELLEGEEDGPATCYRLIPETYDWLCSELRDLVTG